MTPHVHYFCFILPLVAMYRVDVLKDKTVFRKCAQEEPCDIPLAELAPYGILQCFTKCLQFASCSYVRFSSKKLVCRICKASHKVPSGKPKNTESNEDWTCRKNPSLVSCSGCQPGSTCIKSRSGETKCVHCDLQEQLQRRGKWSMQPNRNSKLFNITEQEFTDNWITTSFPGHTGIKSMTWSPSFANMLYSFNYKPGNKQIQLFMLKENSLEKQVGWDNVLLIRTIVWDTMDTGPCLTNDSMLCIYLLSLGLIRSYREIKSPHHLELEREVEITNNLQHKPFSCAFTCKGKIEMAMYCSGAFSETVQKYIILTRQGELAWNENGKELTQFRKIKWNSDYSFAFALSLRNLFLIRYVDDKEQVVFKVKNRWKGEFVLVWSDTSIVVFQHNWFSGDKLHILKF